MPSRSRVRSSPPLINFDPILRAITWYSRSVYLSFKSTVAHSAALHCAIGRSRLDSCVYVQVVDAKTVVDRPGGRSGSSPSRVAECLVGDETGVIVFSAKNEQG